MQKSNQISCLISAANRGQLSAVCADAKSLNEFTATAWIIRDLCCWTFPIILLLNVIGGWQTTDGALLPSTGLEYELDKKTNKLKSSQTIYPLLHTGIIPDNFHFLSPFTVNQ